MFAKGLLFAAVLGMTSAVRLTALTAPAHEEAGDSTMDHHKEAG